MKRYKIYTAGKMSGLPVKEQLGWRLELERLIKSKTDKSIIFIHPPLYYNYSMAAHKSESEVKQWETNQIRDSDIVVVNLDSINESVGTHFELAAVDAANSFGNRHIYTVGIGSEKVHPWIELSLLRREDDLEKAAEYIVNYLLI